MFSTSFTLTTTYQQLSTLLVTAGYRDSNLFKEKGYFFNRDTGITLTIATGDTLPTGGGLTMPARTSIPFIAGLDANKVWIKSASGTPTIEIGLGVDPPAIPSTTNTLGAATGTSLVLAGAMTTSSASDGFGYTSGSGGSVTQITSKSTTVTLDKNNGKITTHNAALNAGTIVSFTFSNQSIGAEDAMVINHISGGTLGAYTINIAPDDQQAIITIRNNTAGNLSEALVLKFSKIEGANT